MNVQQSHPFRSHLNPNQSCFRKYLCENQSRIRNHRIGVLCHCHWHYFFRCFVFQYARNQEHLLPAQLYFQIHEDCYEPDIYGIQQINSVDEETLLLFTSKTDKACLRDLFDSHCFMGEAEKQVHDFCFT